MQSCNDAIRGRIRLLALLLVIFFLYLGGRLYWVQIINHEHYYAEARAKYVTSKTTSGIRGEIFDSQGNLLVGNMPCSDISITPCNIKPEQDAAVAMLLSRCLKLDFREVLAKVSRKTRQVTADDGKSETRPNQYAMIARNVPLAESRKLKALLDQRNLAAGIHFTDVTVRYYPKGKLLANVLGFTNMEHDKVIAVMGVEKFFDKQISASSGKTVYERSRDGRPLGAEPLAETRSRDGLNLYLTIVEPIQAILEEELDLAWAKWRPRAAYAVMADPATGNILAMAQRPSFDPNERADIDPSAYRIRITEDVFEPGSIMKAVTVAGALDYGVVRPETKIDCEQRYWFYRGKSLSDTHAYGIQDVTGVIRKSSNIGTAKIAIMMGERRLERTLRKFGFGARTGLPLKPETRGLLPPLRLWDGLSISRFGMGYGVAVSPVQMLRAYCALASRGRLPQLRLVDRVEDPETGIVTRNPVTPPVQVFNSPHTGEEIVKMMVAVTEEGGTATRAAIPGYHVAGKTGTARKLENGRYISKYYGSFVGFVPAEKPAFVLLVTLDEPKGSYYGGTVAGPAWRAIAERTLKYLDVKPTIQLPEKKTARQR